MTITEWFAAHPEAAAAAQRWLQESTGGTRKLVAHLQAEHGYPFRDHTSLRAWAQARWPKSSRRATLARWFNDRPIAARVARQWAGTTASLLEVLQRQHDCPFSDLKSLREWVRRQRRDNAPTFQRTAKDLRTIERTENLFVTSAVQEAHACEGFLAAIERWREERQGALVVNPVNYVNPRTRGEEDHEQRERWWDPRLEPYMLRDELRPHPDLSIMATKTQATAGNPLPARLSGRTKHRSAVFGHPQLSMRTVPTPQSKPPKTLYSSGAITEKWYSDTLAGDMAEFHHTIGGVIVEVRGSRFHLREVAWDGESFIDLDRRYYADRIEDAPPPEALVMGDIHAPHHVAPNVMQATFGPKGIYEQLSPRRLVLHDLADNRAVNPHEARNRLTRAAMATRQQTLVQAELYGVVEWLRGLPEFQDIAVVYSNHDDFLTRWLERAQPEPENAELYHYLCYRMLQHHRETGQFPIALELALREIADLPDALRFLAPDESFRLHGVELGMHGHWGPNGARGSARNLSYIGTRSMIGHVHSPCIWQGVYAVGLTAEYRHGYNIGPSSWLQSHGLLHANGYRQLLHIIGEHFRG